MYSFTSNKKLALPPLRDMFSSLAWPAGVRTIFTVSYLRLTSILIRLIKELFSSSFLSAYCACSSNPKGSERGKELHRRKQVICPYDMLSRLQVSLPIPILL